MKKHSRIIALSLIGALACIALGMYVQKTLLARPPAEESEIKKLTQTIGVFMELPVDEIPTLATVTDTAKLPAIPFFSHAKKGDKVLIYQKSAKAYLYRPSSKKVIDTSVFSQPIVEKEPLTVELRNGTSKNGITADFEKKLNKLAPELRVIAKETAKRRDFADSMVIAKSPLNEKTATSLAKALNIAEGQMPAKEASTSADIVIILGSDALGDVIPKR